MRQKSPVLTLTVALLAALTGCTDSSPEQIHSPFSGTDGGGSYAPPSSDGDLSGTSGISGHDGDAGGAMMEDASVPVAPGQHAPTQQPHLPVVARVNGASDFEDHHACL